ncbi:putative ABC transporter [Cellulomonas flavigena DSM 20109]|uniref:Putative ABC transporter n=1 Tax=Cellulomonas flavigena (strain ATCC 482 / DSM 20109 / BCRC 11376 / JCM 18109 / NBRC 3775 / NCIMB 8073 / NRS 134) TaxID=446466 RepID=D5UCD7_CELFN|nr:dynamin family protein [Cellulomonas flavigena]ADG74251.1 putative ABC transporter [Cellulomonas flavigena DSM 20109]
MTEPEVSAAAPRDAVGGVADADDGAAAAGLLGALERLHVRLAALELPLEAPGAETAREGRDAALAQLDGYLLPRLRARSAPLLVVVGGSTGAGKSTLVNSLLGAEVSVPGVLRPTTRAPVLVHHPLDERWYSTDRVLPGLARLTGTPPGRTSTVPDVPPGGPTPTTEPADPARALRLVASDALPRGLALLDAPDVDSVDVGNRRLAAQLLDAADLWLFVTTAARYADAVPWDLLLRAAQRHAQVALVVDRVDPGTEEVADDLRRMMDENGLPEARLFVVRESTLTDGLLPETAVREVARWLTDLGADAGAREAVALATRDGVVQDLARRARELADAVDAQVATDARLRRHVATAYTDAAASVRTATSDGAMLRGEVLARWQEFVGTGELLRSVEQGVGRVRDAVTSFFRGAPAQAPRVEHAIASGLGAVVLDAADTAAERTHGAWRADPAGAALLRGLDLARASGTLRAEVDAQVRGWQADVLDLVREQGAARRGTARYLSFGVNAAGLSLMVLAFASTGGLTGVEVGIAGGTAVVAQKLLEAVFGDDAVRRLTAHARERLDARVEAVLAREAERYTAQLDASGVSGTGDDLRAAADDVDRAARTERSARPAPASGGRPALVAGRTLRGADAAPDGGPVAGDPDARGGDAPRAGFWRRLLGRGRDDA